MKQDLGTISIEKICTRLHALGVAVSIILSLVIWYITYGKFYYEQLISTEYYSTINVTNDWRIALLAAVVSLIILINANRMLCEALYIKLRYLTGAPLEYSSLRPADEKEDEE